MSIFSKKKDEPKKNYKYRKIVTAAKISSPILKGLYYAFFVGVFLLAIIALIVLFVGTEAKDMMLPPYMTFDGNEYSITIGNGIRVIDKSVGSWDIKTVAFAELMMLAAIFCILAPTTLFLSKLAKNIAKGDEYNLKNPRYVIYIGLSVMVGSTFIAVIRSFYNYLLVKTFASDPDAIKYAFDFDLGAVAVGVLIIVLAYIYGSVCERNFTEAPVAEAKKDIEPV
ncbi:MAG: DUF2975 domain-containing protein [Clostridia bacterium]|nr:DUF2975 domain-containing protein [Clostridia bacterium]